MWSRLALPIQRNVLGKSIICLQTQNIHINAVWHKYKGDGTNANRPVMKRDSNDQRSPKKFNGNRESLLNSAPLIARNDPEMFGSNEKVTEKVPDEGDIADEEYHRNYVLRKDQLSQRKYEHMIKTFIRDKRLKEAIDVVEVKMKEDRVKPEYYVYDLLIIECGRSGFTKKAFKLYSQMRKRGLKVSGPTYVALFNACSKSIHPKEALGQAQDLRQKIIQNGFQANEIVYNAMIKAFGRCGDIETAFQLVDEMKDKKLRLKIDTMNHLLQVCCSDREHGFRHALIVWHKIFNRNMIPDAYSYNLLLRCTRDCGVGDFEEMRKVIEHVLCSSKSDIKLNQSKNQILYIEDEPKVLINENSAESLEKPKNKLVSEEVRDQMPNLLSKLPHLGSIVELSMVKTPEDRLMLFGGLTGFIAEMENNKVRPNVKTFSQLLYAIPSTREAEHELIEKMRSMRVRADTDFFNLLMKQRIYRKDYDGAKQVMELLKNVNLDPDIATYGILAMSCVSREQAMEFIEMLTGKGLRLNNEILGALLNNATYIKDYDFVIDVVEYAINERISPSHRFMEMLNEFNKSRYFTLRNRSDDDEEYIKFKRFYRVYKDWKVHNNLVGCSGDDISKSLRVHPWKQIKEDEGYGLERVKNSKIRRLWKRQHTLEKLTPNRIKNLPNVKDEIDDKYI